ncbi:autotransporter domain-containing protein [Bradyrhizobium sp. 4]|uniref:autotransporter outer membrane beta-barrel domain-containing protein n=1 Tax=unclassified Bradyrhizobium TaxID=2631580 RepID=UPI001FFB941B|nr:MULTISPECIES: autotransporter outer membrane beta-barrel domain-containing protein [unclassified Bradyrhizobium]MCK1396961.1 autotransporter domain-containing protein [Bradyrhizobium sp. 39]MCK1747895.1 autotransporter domain-containing protein [Bradyrhizobium sp. 135]UPJ33285.1 autotransporter domain-containing protein [Bradyrhizobium sp. 4]
MAGPTKAGGRNGYGLRSGLRHSLATLLATTALGVVAAHALDGDWVGGTSDWTDGTNWSSNPIVPDVTATFTNTGSTAVDNNNGVVVIGTINFANTAQAYSVTIGNPFIINGTGIINDSGNAQNFEVTSGNNLVFQNSSTARGGVGAGAVIITNDAGGTVNFLQNSTAGSATLVNNNFVTFEDSSSAGNALITNNANGQIDFFTSASAGSATINNLASATLNFHNNTTAATSTITNDGTVNFDGSSTGGSARFVNNVGGTVDISGLTSTGMTAGSIEGAGNYVLGAKTLTTGSVNTSTQVDGVISGTGGGLTKVGTGTLTLTGINGYTGPTTISAGTLAISGFGSIASSSVVTVNATLDISAVLFSFNPITTLAGNSAGIVNMGANSLVITNGSTEFAGVIQGTGGLEVFGGTQTLSGVNTYSNVTQIDSAATLALKGSGSIANSLYVAFSGPGATLDISQTTSGASVTQLFSFGASGVVALGSKTLTITSGNSFGGVIQDGGIGGGTAGNLAIANGAVQQLYGTNTYTGTTTIASGGELDLINSAGSDGSIATSRNVIANGIFDISALSAGTSIKSLAGSGNVNIGANTLTITNGIGNFAGVIDDGGAGGGLTIAGGKQTLSGANTYSGPTTVNGGTLVVDGSILSSTTVNAGGTLAGSGTVAGVAVNGGTLAPGSTATPFGPLTINGPLSFTAASTYLVQVSSSNASLANVNGAATLGNATVSAMFVSGTIKKQYTILSATGGFGGTAFNAAVLSNLPTINASLSYGTNNVFLNIGVNFAPSGGLTVNQQNVATTLANFFNSTGGIPAAFAALTPAGLTTASGELGTGIIQSAINADGQFLNLMLDPTVIGRSAGFAKAGSVAQFAESDDAAAYASMRPANAREREAYAMATKAPLLVSQPASRWSLWTAGYGGSAQVGGNAPVGSQDLTARVWGGAAGADYRVSVDTLVGFALGGGGLSYSLANAMGSGSADLFQAGVYGRHNFGPAYISAALAYGWHDVTTNRTVAPGGFDQLQSRFKADTFSARFEGGYRFATPMIGLTPYAAAQVTNFNLPSYSEVSLNGGGLFALNYASQSLTDPRSELGLRTDKSYAMQNGVLTLRGRAAWAHDYNPGRAVLALFQTLPGTSFVVNGARVDADSALVSASAEMKWLSGFSIAGTFDGEFSGNVTSYSGKGVFKYAW